MSGTHTPDEGEAGSPPAEMFDRRTSVRLSNTLNVLHDTVNTSP